MSVEQRCPDGGVYDRLRTLEVQNERQEHDVQGLHTELFGKDGGPGLKEKLGQCVSMLKIVAWVGGIIGATMVADFMSRVLGSGHRGP